MENVLQIEGHEKADGRLRRSDEKQAEHGRSEEPILEKGEVQNRHARTQLGPNKES